MMASASLRLTLSAVTVSMAVSIGIAGAADHFDIVFPPEEMTDVSTLELDRKGERLVDSEVRPGTRLRAIDLRFHSFTWEGEKWMHDATLLLPAEGVAKRVRGTGVVVAGIRPFADAAAAILGVPALLVTSGNPGPRYGQPKEGELMGVSLERMTETEDPRWNGYAWLGKVLVRGVTVMAALPETCTERAVTSGCSKRGMAAWIAAAADDRVVGAFPTCWNTGNYRETAKLLVDRFGGDYQRGSSGTKAPAFVSAREQYERTLHPRFQEFVSLTDPVVFRDRISDDAILWAFGTNDPLYHVLSCNLVLPELEGDKRVALVPNTEHTPNTPLHVKAWAMWVAHSLLGRDVPAIDVKVTPAADGRIEVTARVAGRTRIDTVELWWAEDPGGAYNGSTWEKTSMTGEGGVYRSTVERPSDAHLVFFVAVHDDDPGTCPGYVTSRPIEVRRGSG